MGKRPGTIFRLHLTPNMNTSSSTKTNGWETIRQKGKKRFILFTGILLWGVPMFVIMTFFKSHTELNWNWPSFFFILGQLTTWTLGGILYGWFLWKILEKRFQRQMAAQKDAMPTS